MKTVAATIVMVAIIAGVAMSAPSSQSGDSSHTVTQADMDRWKVEVSNWGRWGKDDEKGTLNLITPQKRKQAADLVRDGVAISLARPANTEKAVDNPQPYENVMISVRGPASSDRIAVSFHGYAHTHLDALGHHFFDGNVALGMNVFDNCDLDALAEAAASRKRWEFLLTAAPLPMVRGTGSPINPIALF